LKHHTNQQINDINMLTPIINPRSCVEEAVGPSLVDGESAPLSQPLVGEEGAAKGVVENESTNQNHISVVKYNVIK
jgi:hypothetical protein